MASPQESITTVNGRRCTRSRARTAATSVFTTQETTAVEAPQVTTQTTAQEAPPAQTTAAEAAPAPPASSAAADPPPSSPAVDQPAPAPTTTQAAVSSAIGTISAVPVVSIPSTPAPPLAVAPAPVESQPAVVVPQRPVATSRPAAAAVPSETVEDVAAAPPPVASTTSSDTLSTAALPISPDVTSQSAPLFTAPGAADSAVLQTSLIVEISQTSPAGTSPEPTTANAPNDEQPQPTTTAVSSTPTGDAAAGIIGPEQGGSDSEAGLTIPSNGDANIGSIVGGVVGGVAGLAMICALLFFLLRKRKAKQPRWAEKSDEGPRFLEKLKAIPASVGVLVAKVKGMKKGPTKNPYHRHSQQASVSSIYSTPDSQGFYAPGDFSFAKRPGSRSSRSSKKSERNVLRKKNGSVSSQLSIKPILENKIDISNPFADPEPPRILRLSNPDASPAGPLTPQPAMTSAPISKDPFVSPLDPPGPFLPARGHARSMSQASALSSHPPSFVFPARQNSLNKGPIGPPPPSQAPPPAQKRRSSMALPTFDATSSAASGETDYALFGEPGPSRPPTRLFTPGPPTGRTVRQSDPFDLDRPEVLGFGMVSGRREMRGSVTRQPTRSRRTSTAGNWSTVNNDGPSFSWNMIPRR